jgi:outer membrane protein TolC
MKRTLFILILLLPFQVLYAQEDVLLDSCYAWARNNYPNLKQAGIWTNITALQKENIQTNSLPRITLHGQATYQSDVTGIDIPLPNISVPRPSKDQYKAYAEIRQSIWDGGISEANARLEDAILRNHLGELEVEIYKLNQQVAQAFFTILISNKQNEVLEAQKTVLEEQLKATQSAVRHGTAEKTPELLIRAEILNLEQNEVQMESVKSAAIGMLSVLTGRSISSNSKFSFSDPQTHTEDSFSRPEKLLFESQRMQMENQMDLLDKSRNPKVFGFGQAGYGKPGLNMLSDEFDTYYLVGAGISWNPFDWKEAARKKQVLQLQQEMIIAQEQTFLQNINLLIARQQEEINKLEVMLEADKEIVDIRSEITAAATSKLENETLTTSEYLREVQAETIAKLNYELHKIQLNEAREKHVLIKGKE